MIIDQGLGPGDTLPAEGALAASFNVSKPVIREGLSQLVGLGLIESRKGSVATVKKLTGKPLEAYFSFAVRQDPHGLRQAIELRRVLEEYVVTVAAKQATDQDIHKLRRCLGHLYVTRDLDEEWARADAEFHSQILEIAQNPTLGRILTAINDALWETVTGVRSLHHPDTLAPEWGWAARATPSTALAISPEGDRVYQAVVEDEGDDARLLVRDLQTGRVLHVMTAVAPLEHLEVDRRGWVYGLEQGRRGRAVVALQPRGGEVETVWRHELAGESDRSPGRLAIGRDRVAVWGVGEEEDLLLLTTEDGSVVGRSAPAPLDGAFDPDGSLWVLRPGVLHRLE